MIISHPWRELARQVAGRLDFKYLTAHERGWACVDSVYTGLDRDVAEYLLQARGSGTADSALRAVYCYEDCALDTFKVAKQHGLKCFYDLPIAYWETSQRLLLEEAQRLPEWEPTLGATQDSPSKLTRKTYELMLADIVFCPSKFVLDSLPETVRDTKTCVVAEFGSPGLEELPPGESGSQLTTGPLRLLFAGSLSQRKGLADVFQAVKLLNRSDVQLVVMGSPLVPMDFYRKQFPGFKYEPPRPHFEVLKLMRSCHALVLPSIVEGRALVQQEAMSCGLPIIVTYNAGGSDLIEQGTTGFLVPIRSPESIAEKINWLADNRSSIPEMGKCAATRAQEVTWRQYQSKIISVIQSALGESVADQALGRG